MTPWRKISLREEKEQFLQAKGYRVVIAMSGGVDSSVAAALLKKQGYQAIGVTMQIWPKDRLGDKFGGCCGIGAVEDARRVAYKLGIPHYVMNFRNIFEQKVISDFCREYSRGRTPNPCVRCNQHIKFDALLKRAEGLDADFIATGHYARIEVDEATGRYNLRKGVDRRKDQSYFLYTLNQEQLSHVLMPVGGFTKDRVREIASEMGLPVATKSESQEICFIPDDDYPQFLKDYVPQAAMPGPIMDEQENILGTHHGILSYTVGQRKRLGIAATEPLYVTAIEPERNAVIVGNKQEAHGDELIASEMNWITITELKQTIIAKARIRYRHAEAEAQVIPTGKSKVYVKFKEPQSAITPGQAIVFYDGETVIGGGTIDQTRKIEIAEISAEGRRQNARIKDTVSS